MILGLTAVAVKSSGNELVFGDPQALFEVTVPAQFGHPYVVSNDGQRVPASISRSSRTVTPRSHAARASLRPSR